MKKTPLSVFAFTPLTQGLENVESGGALGRALQSANIGDFLQAAFDVAIVVGAMLAVLQIGRAGVMYMTGDIISNKSRAKEILQDAIIGLVVLISIVIILKQINPNILKLDFNATPVNLEQGGLNGQQTPTDDTPAQFDAFGTRIN
jgi:hypothetical protein